MQNIELEKDYVLLEPVAGTSSFSTETRKYDRKAIAIVRGISQGEEELKPGDKIIFDDKDSIDFELEGQKLCIVSVFDIVARIKEANG